LARPVSVLVRSVLDLVRPVSVLVGTAAFLVCLDRTILELIRTVSAVVLAVVLWLLLVSVWPVVVLVVLWLLAAVIVVVVVVVEVVVEVVVVIVVIVGVRVGQVRCGILGGDGKKWLLQSGLWGDVACVGSGYEAWSRANPAFLGQAAKVVVNHSVGGTVLVVVVAAISSPESARSALIPSVIGLQDFWGRSHPWQKLRIVRETGREGWIDENGTNHIW